MEKLIYCHKLKKEAKALPKPPFPGPLGEEIHEKVSEEAWGLWLTQQTILINEHRLSLVDPKARAFLQEQMKKFFFSDNYEMPSEYTPPE